MLGRESRVVAGRGETVREGGKLLFKFLRGIWAVDSYVCGFLVVCDGYLRENNCNMKILDRRRKPNIRSSHFERMFNHSYRFLDTH